MHLKTIGIYMPRWLYHSDKTDRIFADELFATIKRSHRYKPVRITIPDLLFFTSDGAKRFCERRNLVAIVHHNSPFYSTSKRYLKNVLFLQEHVLLLNSHAVHSIGHSKISTKRFLRERGIPVLDEAIVSSTQELNAHLVDGLWYVIKPSDKGAGTAVKLVKREDGALWQFCSGRWVPIVAISKKPNALMVRRNWELTPFTYAPMLVEPYFNDDPEGFASLRCTVIGDEIVETVKRLNRSNITSNVSSGGIATKIELTNEQREIVLATAKALNLDYAGIDILVCGGKSVIGEVNIGPFTVFSAYTGVSVGKKLAKYVMDKCDYLPHSAVDK